MISEPSRTLGYTSTLFRKCLLMRPKCKMNRYYQYVNAHVVYLIEKYIRETLTWSDTLTLIYMNLVDSGVMLVTTLRKRYIAICLPPLQSGLMITNSKEFSLLLTPFGLMAISNKALFSTIERKDTLDA